MLGRKEGRECLRGHREHHPHVGDLASVGFQGCPTLRHIRRHIDLPGDLGLRRAQGPLRIDASAYYTRFSGFISKHLTGLTCGEAKIQTERKLRIVERVAEVSVTAELLGDGVSFADPPRVVPSAGLWATVLKFAFVGLVGGLVPAMLVAWVRAERRPIAQRTDEVADLLGMAPIAHVASMSELLRTEIFDASDSSVQLCAANISSIIDGGVLLFTSPAPIIGSGEFLVKVGVGLAQAGKRVLVVDADPAGSVCRTLGIDEEVGIADVMAGQNLDRVRTANISFNRAPGLGDARLRVIAPGKTHDHMGALARTPSATAAFGEFRGQHDYVLVSLPPLSVSASSTAFGRLADGIVLSVPQGMAVDQLADTRRRVDFFGTSALGFVLIQD